MTTVLSKKGQIVPPQKTMRENHTHVAMQELRRLDLIWQGATVAQYEQLKADASEAGMTIPDFVKEVLAKPLDKKIHKP